MAEYVNNERLREVVNQYNNLNIYDKGEWCAAYLQRLENKHANNKVDDNKFILGRDFIIKKVKQIEDLQAHYASLNSEEKRRFDLDFERIKNEMCEYFILIINGRINSFKLRTSLRNPEEIDDIVQDALICVLNYINRYDEARGTSAFAFVTQLATNSIKLSLNQIKEREKRMVSGLDYYENLNTTDEQQGLSGINKYLE